MARSLFSRIFPRMCILLIVFCSMALPQAGYSLIESNDFTSSLGNWRHVQFSANLMLFNETTKQFLGANQVFPVKNSSTATIENGWAKLTSTQGGFDDCIAWASGGGPSCESQVYEGSGYVATGGGIFYPAPTGDWTFLTKMKADQWVSGGGEHQGGDKMVMIRNDIDSIENHTSMFMISMVCANYDNGNGSICPNGVLAVQGKNSPDEHAAPLPQSVGTFGVGSSPVYVKITKVADTYTWYFSNDSSTWTQVDQRTGDYDGWLALTSNEAARTSNYYDFVRVYGNGQARNWNDAYAQQSSGVKAGSLPLHGRLPFEYSHGALSFTMPASEGPVRLNIFNAKGSLVDELTFNNGGSHRIALHRQLTGDGIYFAELTNGNFKISTPFSMMK